MDWRPKSTSLRKFPNIFHQYNIYRQIMYHKISFNQSLRWDLSNKKTSFQPYPHIFADSSRLRGGKLLSPNVDCRRWIALRWNTNNNRQHSLIFADLQQQKKTDSWHIIWWQRRKKTDQARDPLRNIQSWGLTVVSVVSAQVIRQQNHLSIKCVSLVLSLSRSLCVDIL